MGEATELPIPTRRGSGPRRWHGAAATGTPGARARGPAPAASGAADVAPEADAMLWAELRAIGLAAGLDALGVTGVEPFREVRAEIERRVSLGLHDGMRFTFAKPERSTDPSTLLPGARSLVVAARSYRREAPDAVPDGPLGQIARYAWTDHYRTLKEGLNAVSRRLRADGWRTRVVADDNALVDRAAAARAGIGWLGKSANLLLPGQGSWFVLGAVATTALLPPAVATVPDGCGTCVRCLDGCPTGAIVGDGVVDARRCLAWLVQRPGIFPEEFAAALGTRIYGCDDCQEVCPPNRIAQRQSEPVPAESGSVAVVALVELVTLTDDQLLARHGRFYLPGRDPSTLRRNALLGLANVLADRDCAASVDPGLRADADATALRLTEHRDAGVRAAAHRLAGLRR